MENETTKESGKLDLICQAGELSERMVEWMRDSGATPSVAMAATEMTMAAMLSILHQLRPDIDVIEMNRRNMARHMRKYGV